MCRSSILLEQHLCVIVLGYGCGIYFHSSCIEKIKNIILFIPTEEIEGM